MRTLLWVSLLICLAKSLAFAPIRPQIRLPPLASSSSGYLDEPLWEDGDDDPDRLTDEELEASMGEWDDKIARFNTIHLTGRIGSDPEARYFDDGKVVVNVPLACKQRYLPIEWKELGVKSGEEETDWYSLEIWGQTAEFVNNYVDKGTRVGVVGSLQIDQWNDRDTNELRSNVKVIVRDLDILETRAETESRRSNKRGPSFYQNDDDDDDGYSPAGSGGFF